MIADRRSRRVFTRRLSVPAAATRLHQRLGCGASAPQIGLRPAELGFPFLALEQLRIPARLDRLRVAMAYAVHAQQQSFLWSLRLGVSK